MLIKFKMVDLLKATVRSLIDMCVCINRVHRQMAVKNVITGSASWSRDTMLTA